jgi:serine O-acetyltransferase
VVLQPVPPHTTAAGVPARIVGKPESDKPRWIWISILMGLTTGEYGDGFGVPEAMLRAASEH